MGASSEKSDHKRSAGERPLPAHLAATEDTLRDDYAGQEDPAEPVQALRRRQQAPENSEDRYRHLVDLSPDAILVHRQGKFVFANPAAGRLFGANSPAELIGRTVRDLVHPDVRPLAQQRTEQADADSSTSTREMRFLRLDGSVVEVETAGSCIEFEGQPAIQLVVRDISERKQREQELSRLNGILTALSHSNQAMTRAQTEAEYLDEICRIVIEDCHHALVWIGYVEHDEAKSVQPVASAGFEEGYLETLQITWADTERGQGPTGVAIRTGQATFCRNMLTDPQFAPWRDDAIKRGYASSLVLPLMTGDQVFGTICVYSREPDSFTDEEARLLTELADDLAYGIMFIRLREAKRHVEESLRQSEERLRLALAAGGMAAWEWQLSADHSVWNDGLYRMLGYAPGAVEPSYEAWRERVHPDDLAATERTLQQTIERGGDYADEFRVVWPDGTVRWLEARGRFELDAAGKPLRAHGVVVDVTNHKSAEQALRQTRDELEQRVAERTAELAEAGRVLEAERQRLYDLLEALPAHVILLTPDYRVLFANRFFEEQFGKTHDRRCFEGLFGRDQPCEDCTTLEVLKTGLPMCRDRVGPGGRDYEVTAVPFTDVDGSPLVMEMGIDVTQRMQAERDLRQRSEQLRALASQLTLAEQRERRRLAQVLHDGLQQILVGARYRLSVLENAPQTDIRRAATEVSDLLDEAIETSRRLTYDLGPPILHEGGLVPALEWLARWMQDRHGLTVELQAKDDVLLTEDLTILLFQATWELLFNVVKHAGVRSAAVRVSRVDEQICILVEDNGVGFDVQQVQAGVDVERGFGLFAIRERLELLAGRLDVDSAPGQGSRFSLVAPLTASADENATWGEEGAARVSVATTAAGSHRFPPAERKTRVVLVDDHVVMRQGLTRLIRAQPDMAVVGEASDGRSAIELARRVRPDVVVMDVSMPGVNGIEATRTIHTELPDVKVIGLSMFEEAERANAMRAAGAVDYLTKNGSSDALVRAIRDCIPSPPDVSPPAGD